MRKGYLAEYKFKKQAEKEGWLVFKLAIGQLADFITFNGFKWDLWEIKEGFKKRYYPREREKRQIQKIKELAEEYNISAFLLYYQKKKQGKKSKYLVQDMKKIYIAKTPLENIGFEGMR
jgi:hypothetical protein